MGATYDVAACAIGRVAEARLLILDGDVRQGLALLDEARIATISGELDALSTGVVYCELVCALEGLALYDVAEQWTEAMERWCETNAIGSLHGRCRVHRAEILRLRGSCHEAQTQAMMACEELRPYLRRALGWPLNELGRIRLHQRLLGLDRAPEVKTMRRRMEALAGLGRADRLIDALARRHLRDARHRLRECEAAEGKASIEGRRPTPELLEAFAAAHAEVDRLAAAAKAIPAKVPLGQARPDAVRLAPERKRIHDAIRMATYNAESALARMLAPHYARADDEARSLVREAFPNPGRSRSRRRPTPRTPLPAISTPTDPGHRRSLRGTQRNQDHLPRHRPHPRLLHQGGPMTPQRRSLYVRRSGFSVVFASRNVCKAGLS